MVRILSIARRSLTATARVHEDAPMAAPNEISVSQLARLVGTPDAPALIDLRTPEDFEADPTLIPGAARHDHAALGTLAPRRPARAARRR